MTSAGAAVRGVVVDIEGTTSATSAVHVGLYDFARPRIEPWLRDHADDPDVAAAIDATREAAGLAADASISDVAEVHRAWMRDDVKATPLKTVQGQIWAAGFATGDLTAHFFDDVAPQLRAWHDRGLQLAVYSSGSVAVQEPWFRSSPSGDLAELMSAYFDTVNAGPKREADSYRAIATALAPSWRAAPGLLVFLSDVAAELDAARAAGWQTIGLRRPGEPSEHADFGEHAVVASFADIDLTLAEPDRVASR